MMHKDAETQAQDFNERFAVGQAVALELDNGTLEETFLRSAAWVTGGHSAIAKVDGHAGGWLINRIHPRQVDLT